MLLRPGERPLDELRRVLVSGAKDPLAEALDALPADERLLLAVDQLEELFTACRSEAERAAFADTLARAAADPEGRAVVVVALRADFYGRFAAYPGLAELLGANHVLVGPMQASELRRAVELPAGRVGLRVEPELADALVDDVEGEPGALPLLSTALLELWQKRQDNALTLAAYRESGGVHGAVARLAEGTYARIPDERKPLVRAIMLRLVGEGEGDAPVRRRAPLAELDLERNEDVADVLATLADSRLVTVGEGSVEVAHEALLREWPRLREWIEEDAEGRRLRRHITQAATEWDAAGRDQGELYRGARLAAALDWTADHALDLNELEREFVTESREASEQETKRARRTNRRLRALLAGVAVLLAAAVAGGIFAVIQRGEARDAETAQLAQRLGAQALVEEDLDRSLLLARQAVAIDDSPQTRGYLLADLLRAPGGDRDHARPSDDAPPGDRGQPRREDAGGRPTSTAGCSSSTPGLRADRRAAAGDGRASRALAYSPDGRDARGRRRRLRSPDRRAHAGAAGARRPSGASRAAAGLHERRLAARRARRPAQEAAPTRITIRDAATLEPIGSPIEPEGFAGAYIGSYYRTAQLRAHARRPLARHRVGRRRARLVGSPEPARRRGRSRSSTGHHALALSPDGRTAAVGIDARHPAGRRAHAEPCETATGALAAEPELAAVQPGRQDGRVDEPRRDGRRSGTSGRRPSARRCAATRARPAARLQPRREDALHGESRRDGDRLGPQRRPRARAARSRSRTTGAPTTGYDGHPGSSARTAG